MPETAVDMIAQVRDLAQRVRNLELEVNSTTGPTAAVTASLERHYVSRLAGRPRWLNLHRCSPG